MKYQLSIEQFKNSKMFDSRGKLHHKPGNRFKLFPFTGRSTGVNVVLELEPLIGSFLCMIEEKSPQKITAAELVEKLKKDIEIQSGEEELFLDMIRKLFFTENGTMRAVNLQMIEQISCTETNEKKMVEYLVDVLGDSDLLRKELSDAKLKLSNNVLETEIISKLKFENRVDDGERLKYFRVVESLHTFFEEDFAYILEDQKCLREYLVELLELYYFSYTAQTILQLGRFMDGERNNNIPLYFCLEWEKTSQSRLCFTEGWQKLQNAIEKIFAHAITLEILNQTENNSEIVDYIRLNEIVDSDEKDKEISKQIDLVTALYRTSITDCVEMNELEKKSLAAGMTAASIRFLFDSIKLQFETAGRRGVYTSYKKQFEYYCKKFLKSRGRSGMMLNLSEERLIFITKLCIKNQEKMRLKEVFKAFEKRGIFLDDISKDQVADYYEKLNLIEKKSDSGDAKYVKRIL